MKSFWQKKFCFHYFEWFISVTYVDFTDNNPFLSITNIGQNWLMTCLNYIESHTVFLHVFIGLFFS